MPPMVLQYGIDTNELLLSVELAALKKCSDRETLLCFFWFLNKLLDALSLNCMRLAKEGWQACRKSSPENPNHQAGNRRQDIPQRSNLIQPAT